MKDVVPIGVTKHLKSKNSEDRATITALEDGRYGISFCANGSNFDRSVGSSLSYHRAVEQEYMSGQIEEDIEGSELHSKLRDLVVEHFPEDDFIPEDLT